MACIEKKGRFTVSISEKAHQATDSLTPSPQGSKQAAVGSPRIDSARAVKRGRFLVSCQPCSSPALSQGQGGGLQQGHPVIAPCGSRSTCSSDDSHLTGSIEHSVAAAREVTSPCRDTPHCPAVHPPADSPARRVRFSETADCLPTAVPCTTPAQAQLQEPGSPQQEQHTASKRKQQQEAPRQLRHTRSYCSGRFMIQEAVAVQASMLHRSTSAPECAAAAAAGCMSSSLSSSCSSMQSLQGPFSAVQDSISPSHSESCFAQAGMLTCGDLYVANQLMSGFLQLPQPQHVQPPAAPVLGCHPAAGGIFATPSVPMPVLGTASSEEESSLAGSCMSYDCMVTEAAGQAGPASFCYATNASSSKRRSHGGSSNMLLGGCYSAGADVQLVAAAAAAAVGHHQQHQHLAPKRSASMTYFRRGRFLVQTTMG